MPLDPEIAAYLEAQKGHPPRSSLSVHATREMMRRAAMLAGPGPALPRVENIELPRKLRARQYWPEVSAELPLLVYFHGGRFFSGDLETHDAVCRSIAAAGGCRVLALDYRLAPEHRFPCALKDAESAVRWAQEQRVPMGVVGDSAGANLAAGAALRCRDAGLMCQVLIYPMLDPMCSTASHREFATGYGPGSEDMLRGWREYLPEGIGPRDPGVSPLFAEDLSGLPPALVITAEYDCLRDEGEAYARKLVDAGVPVEMRRYAGVIHGFMTLGSGIQATRQAIEDVGAYVKRQLEPVTPL
jgi:acetyl esterase